MRTKLLRESDGLRTFAVVFSTGDELGEGLLRFAREHRVRSAEVSGIGGLSEVVLGFFEMEKKEYLRIPIREQLEVMSLLGNISEFEGAPRVHAHIIVGKSDGSAWGGHLLEGHVRPTMEVFVSETGGELRRKKDDETGLPLLEV
jgi:predicted DNA-binding protein with PD1-like motif